MKKFETSRVDTVIKLHTNGVNYTDETLARTNAYQLDINVMN